MTRVPRGLNLARPFSPNHSKIVGSRENASSQHRLKLMVRESTNDGDAVLLRLT